MRRGTIFIILFVVAAVGIVGASQFVRTQPPLEIRVAVSPLAAAWVSESVSAFNATNPLVNSTRRVHYTVETVDDTQVWLDETRRWTTDDHPQGWIPAASFSIRLAGENRLPFATVQPSLAWTPLVWGGLGSLVEALEADGGAAFDWAAVADAARQRRLAFNNPARTISGLGVLLSGAGAYYSSAALTGSSLNDSGFLDWIEPVLESVPNFNTLGASVAQTWAARGASIGELGLLPESDWLQNLRGFLAQSADPLTLRYPQYTVVFDFPLARWQDTTTPGGNDEAAAIEVLGGWLSSPAQQTSAQNFGLRPATGEPSAEKFLDAQPYGALLRPVVEAVQPPSLNDLRRMEDWVNSIVR
jgi:hypothetical protein